MNRHTTPVVLLAAILAALIPALAGPRAASATSATRSSTAATETTTATTTSIPVQRIYGTDAIGTSIAISQAEFPGGGSAHAVVLARSDFFADALAGGPLAARVGGPLLITPGASLSSTLDPRVQAEIQRVLAPGGTVYILGGDLALSSQIDTTLQGLGFLTQRIAGSDEFATAVDVADQLDHPPIIFEATGLSFQDALSAVPAAIQLGGVILLTNGNQQAPETAAYLSQYPGNARYAIGGPLAAYGADPAATPVYGQDAYGTSAAVAQRFFPAASSFGAATGTSYSDALSGGVFMGSRGPLLLVDPSGPLPPTIASYLSGISTWQQGYLFGGSLAVGNDVQSELESPQSSPAPAPTPTPTPTPTPAPTSVAVTTASLPNGTVGTSYSATLSATGGTPPYSWIVSSGSLPSGLTLSANGLVSGTPTTSGTSSFTVQVTDSSSPTPQQASQAFSIAISAPQVPTSLNPNWSGYVTTGSSFTGITSTFNVPSLFAGTPANEQMSEWVGIDGYGNSSLIQAGIALYPDPTNLNYFEIEPWWEILPEYPSIVGIRSVVVHPGDEITVTIGQLNGSTWGIELTDDTDGQNFVTDQTYSGPETTAEWIVEAPTVNGSIVSLAPFNPAVAFTNDRYTGTASTLTELFLDQENEQVATPSTLSTAGFSVAYGSTAPPAP